MLSSVKSLVNVLERTLYFHSKVCVNWVYRYNIYGRHCILLSLCSGMKQNITKTNHSCCCLANKFRYLNITPSNKLWKAGVNQTFILIKINTVWLMKTAVKVFCLPLPRKRAFVSCADWNFTFFQFCNRRFRRIFYFHSSLSTNCGHFMNNAVTAMTFDYFWIIMFSVI